MQEIWIYSIASVFIVSILSLIGIFALSIKEAILGRLLIYFVSFSAGALFGDTFIHLIPEIVEENGYNLQVALFILTGIVFSFIIEKVIHWRHCHIPVTKNHVHRFAYMNLFGDLIHNFIDGLIIGASYLVSIPVGIATTVAIILHEIPQEIGDFGVLLLGGFTKRQAVFYNFFTALAAVLGTIFAIWLRSWSGPFNDLLLPFAAGSFIYIAGSDLIPQLHKEEDTAANILQTVMFTAGILVMMVLLLLE